MRVRPAVIFLVIAISIMLNGCEQYRSDVRSAERLETAIEAFYRAIETDDVEGRLLSYPEETIEKLLSAATESW